MSFLNDVDCASYCSMKQSYENPNEVLNIIINPILDSIEVTGGKKRKMKGGAQQQYILILILFLLAVSNVFAGPKYDDLVREFGADVSVWPKETGTQPSKPQNRWNGFIITLGPSSQAQDQYNADLSAWMSDKNRYDKFLTMQNLYQLEYGSEQELAKTKIAIEQTKATAELTGQQAKLIGQQTELQKSITAETQALTISKAIQSIAEMAEKNAQLREQAGFWKGIAIGGGSLLGLLFLYINYMFNRRNRNMPIGYNRNYNGYRVQEPDDPSLTRLTGNMGNLTLGYTENRMVPRIRGGKTKNYRKKRTTKRRH